MQKKKKAWEGKHYVKWLLFSSVLRFASFDPKNSTEKEAALPLTLFMIKFHFIRHGETYANRDGIVLGQTESSLTLGARALAMTTGRVLEEQHSAQGFRYWRVYSSDLHRAKDTAELIGSNYRAHESSYEILVDKRLRERAKGAREGRSERLSIEDALKFHIKEEKAANRPLCLPLLESEDEVFRRLADFIESVVQDAFEEQRMIVEKTSLSSGGIIETLSPFELKHSNVFHVLVVSHSGAIRILLNSILNDDKMISVEPCTKLETGLVIPNLSISTIDIISACASAIDVPTKNCRPGWEALSSTWKVAAVQLPSTKHLEVRESDAFFSSLLSQQK